MTFSNLICEGIPNNLPQKICRDETLAHAPVRNIEVLSKAEKRLAIENALRYFSEKWHKQLANEFVEELETYGRIYMYRFKPTYKMYSRPIEEYPARSKQAASIMLMIQNNLDPLVAKYPDELITYGGNGAVFQNWAQYRLTMKYLSEMTDEQTLVLYSGHPMGLFPSSHQAPRLVITNGMMIPNYSKPEDWNKYNALGVTQYGQMTAGSFMYIGPQGIVHGTTITLLNAGRLRGLGKNSLAGKVFVSSGLGGMSGAQSIASEISGAVGVIAEVDPAAIQQRINDNYIKASNVYSDLKLLTEKIEEKKIENEAITLIYSGNIVDLWEYFAANNVQIDLGSDQTSCHNIESLGYVPVEYTFAEAEELMSHDEEGFMIAVKKSLVRHVKAINVMSERGMYFWDYGNAFLKQAGDADAEIFSDDTPSGYRYPSYVEDIMGPMCFDFGFGPFRWVCTSGKVEDLKKSDQIAGEVLESLVAGYTDIAKGQLLDNIKWIQEAGENIPKVGSMSRILYADAKGRMLIAKAFNDAIKVGVLAGPVVLGRDHHDVSGTDSPFRETANIYDGSRFTADMAVHNVIGDSFRGATWVSLHNGGGVGWGEVINGGFGLVLDGTEEAERKAESMLFWDVNNGIARRSWARNSGAMISAKEAMKSNDKLKITIPHLADKEMLETLFSD